jgi:hypothetical protein
MPHRAIFRRRAIVASAVLLQKLRELAVFVKRRLITQDADLYQSGMMMMEMMMLMMTMMMMIIIIINSNYARICQIHQS